MTEVPNPRGEEHFRRILERVAPGATMKIEPMPAQGGGKYKVMMVWKKSGVAYVSREDFDDLASNGGGRAADIEIRIKNVLGIS